MGDKGKKLLHEKRWQRMRDKVVLRHMRGPVDALEAVVGDVKPLLDPHTRRTQGFVAAVNAPANDDERRTAFEDIIGKAEAVCRQVRIQQGKPKDEYETPVLMPMLDGLSAIIPITEELRTRGLDPEVNFRATSKRMAKVDSLCRTLNDYADALETSVNPDTLWNAYRLDFKGRNKEWLTHDEWQANPFIQNMPETVAVLRPIAEARAIEKLIRKLDDPAESDAGIARAIEKFTAKISPHHTLRAAPFTQLFQTIQNPECDATQRSTARKELSAKLIETLVKMRNRQESEGGLKDLRKRIVEAYGQDVAAYYKKSPLEEERGDLVEDDDNRAKRSAEVETLKDKAFAKVLDAAPHLRDQINAARAEAALRALESPIHDHWRAVEEMYPYRAAGEEEGKGTSRHGHSGKDRKGKG